MSSRFFFITLVINTSLVISSLIFGFLISEGAYRFYKGEEIFGLGNKIREEAFRNNMGGPTIYDENLGWGMRENMSYPGDPKFSTIEFGIRANHELSEVLNGAILATGDSFTAGSEVSDSESWPAFLEQNINTPVLNGGVGGFGVDQSIIRAKILADKVNPKLFILGIFEQDILRVGYRSYGAPKPYYVLGDNNELILRNVPVSRQAIPSRLSFIYEIFGHSHLFVDLTKKLATPIYLKLAQQNYEITGQNEANLVCALLDDFHEFVLEREAKLLVVMQYGGFVAEKQSEKPSYVKKVLRCLRNEGIPFFDEYDTTIEIAKGSLLNLKKLFVMHDGGRTYGHMSSEGNKLIASKLAPLVLKDLSVDPKERELSFTSVLDEHEAKSKLVDLNFTVASSSKSSDANVQRTNGLNSVSLTAVSESAAEHYGKVASINISEDNNKNSTVLFGLNSSSGTNVYVQLKSPSGSTSSLYVDMENGELRLDRSILNHGIFVGLHKTKKRALILKLSGGLDVGQHDITLKLVDQNNLTTFKANSHKASLFKPEKISGNFGLFLKPLNSFFSSNSHVEVTSQLNSATIELRAKGEFSEHYGQAPVLEVPPGKYSFKVLLDKGSTCFVKLNLVFNGSYGQSSIVDLCDKKLIAKNIIGDSDDFSDASTSVSENAKSQTVVILNGSFGGGSMTAQIQLMDNLQKSNFTPNGENLFIHSAEFRDS